MLIRDDHTAPPPMPEETPPDAAAPSPEAEAAKKPIGELRPDLKLFRGGVNEEGVSTWVIFDPVADSYFRLTETDYRIVRLWVGNPTLEAFAEKVARAGLKTTPAHLQSVVLFMHQSNLTRNAYGVGESKSAKMRAMKKKMFWHMLLNYYLFFRIPLWSPDRFISRTLETVEAIFNRWTMMALKILAGFGFLCLIVNFYKFTDAFIASISVQGLLRYSAAVIAIKIIHEFAHAYTARHYGCRVRRMGIAFIFFFPRLYTDLTDSWRIHDRAKRFRIDGAGIGSEILIGGLAALVWANTGEGMTRAVAYYIFAVSIINTLLINGNPFIRYDGYYMLMDLVNIDNLQKRGVDIVRNAWRKHLFGMKVPPDPATRGRRAFLIAYGISSFVYRIFLYLSIILLVYFSFAKALGIVLLILEVYLMIWKPIAGEGRFLIMNRKLLNRKRTLLSLTGAALLVGLLTVPLPWRIAAPCEVQARGGAMIYAPFDGYIRQLPPEDGQRVNAGDLLLAINHPLNDLQLRSAQMAVEITAEQIDQAERSAELIGEARILREMQEHNRATLDELERRERQMRLTSPVSGIFTRHDRQLQPGKYVTRGTLVGEVHDPGRIEILTYIPEDEMKHLRVGDPVEVELNNRIGAFSGKIRRLREMPVTLVPSPVLDTFGGPLLTVSDAAGNIYLREANYLAEIELDGATLPAGRSGVVRIRKYSSIMGNLLRNTVRVLRR